MYLKSGPRRRHSDAFKSKALAACDEPGASISGVVLAHGLNANLVHKWRSGRGVTLARVATAASAPTAPLRAAPEFVAIEMPDALKPPAHPVAEPVAATPIAEVPI